MKQYLRDIFWYRPNSQLLAIWNGVVLSDLPYEPRESSCRMMRRQENETVSCSLSTPSPSPSTQSTVLSSSQSTISSLSASSNFSSIISSSALSASTATTPSFIPTPIEFEGGRIICGDTGLDDLTAGDVELAAERFCSDMVDQAMVFGPNLVGGVTNKTVPPDNDKIYILMTLNCDGGPDCQTLTFANKNTQNLAYQTCYETFGFIIQHCTWVMFCAEIEQLIHSFYRSWKQSWHPTNLYRRRQLQQRVFYVDHRGTFGVVSEAERVIAERSNLVGTSIQFNAVYKLTLLLRVNCIFNLEWRTVFVSGKSFQLTACGIRIE